MHELSIIQSILETAEQTMLSQMDKGSVESVDLQIGDLAGVELSTLEFLWPAAVGDTLLADSVLRIERVPGKAACGECGNEFDIRTFFDPCPRCGSHFLHVRQGEELRIKSLTLSDKPVKGFSPLVYN